MQKRNEWLKQRSKIIGASDVAAILGENPFRTNIDVWADKTGRGDFYADNDHLRFGRDVEGAIANLYETRTKRPVRDLGATVVQIHPNIPWLGATLDRLTEVEIIKGENKEIEHLLNETDITGSIVEVPLELKHVGGMFVRKDDWVEDPPSMYQIQVQIQCECYRDENGNRVPFGSLAGMFPGYQLGWTEMARSGEFFEYIFPNIDKFWNHYVAKDIQPPYTPHDRALDSAKSLYPVDNGSTVVLDNTALSLANELQTLTTKIGEYQKEKKQIQTELRLLLGESTFGSLPDGTFLSLKTQNVKEYTVKARTQRVLRRTKEIK